MTDQLLYFSQQMTGDNDRHSMGFVQCFNQFAKLNDTCRVQTICWFIQYQQFWIWKKASAIASRCFIPKENFFVVFLPVSSNPTICKTSAILVFDAPKTSLYTSKFSLAVKCPYNEGVSTNDPIFLKY